jgi:hypothetical protein
VKDKYLAPLIIQTPNAGGIELSFELMKEVVDAQPILPVSLNFDGFIRGTTQNFKIKNDLLVCHFTLFTKIAFLDESYLVGCFHTIQSNLSKGIMILNRAILYEVTIVGMFDTNRKEEFLIKKDE